MKSLKHVFLFLSISLLFQSQLSAQTTPEQFGTVFIQSLVNDDEAAYAKLFPTLDEFHSYMQKKGLEALSETELAEMGEEMQIDRDYYIEQRQEIFDDADRYEFDWSKVRSSNVSYKERVLEDEDDEGKPITGNFYYITVVVSDGNQDFTIQFDQTIDLEPNIRLAEIKHWHYSRSDEIYPASTPQEFANSFAKALQGYDYNMLFYFFPTIEETVEIEKLFGEVGSKEDELDAEDYGADNWFEYQEDVFTFYEEMEAAGFDVEGATIKTEIESETENIEQPDGTTKEVVYYYCDILLSHGEKVLDYSFEVIKTKNNGYKIIDMVLWEFE